MNPNQKKNTKLIGQLTRKTKKRENTKLIGQSQKYKVFRHLQAFVVNVAVATW